jgi:hypothetical protein
MRRVGISGRIGVVKVPVVAVRSDPTSHRRGEDHVLELVHITGWETGEADNEWARHRMSSRSRSGPVRPRDPEGDGVDPLRVIGVNRVLIERRGAVPEVPEPESDEFLRRGRVRELHLFIDKRRVRNVRERRHRTLSAVRIEALEHPEGRGRLVLLPDVLSGLVIVRTFDVIRAKPSGQNPNLEAPKRATPNRQLKIARSVPRSAILGPPAPSETSPDDVSASGYPDTPFDAF